MINGTGQPLLSPYVIPRFAGMAFPASVYGKDLDHAISALKPAIRRSDATGT